MEAITTGLSSFELPSAKELKKAKKANISDADMLVLSNLEHLKLEIKQLQETFSYETDPDMIDSYIYQQMALNMKYKYYLNLCKERGIIADFFGSAR